jgi:hypothetical protein
MHQCSKRLKLPGQARQTCQSARRIGPLIGFHDYGQNQFAAVINAHGVPTLLSIRR